jgi:heme oxygenase
VTPALQKLEDLTADLLLEGEKRVRILEVDATEATYAQFLGRMFGFHVPLEQAFARHRVLEAVGFSAAQRAKRDWIAQDLAMLGADTSPSLCSSVPLLGDVRRAVGIAYVLERPTLRGPAMVTAMKGRFGLLIGRATRFLEGYREHTPLRWKQFAAIADRVLYDEIAMASAIAGARETYQQLIRWLDEPAMDAAYLRRVSRAEVAT